ncbi:putative cell death in tomato 1 [Rosellinia necatrix]|uniref:Putative cell death in tomato 1 n=1 Tax=Rosellinia necatrix TaxID=77044 RepID=A0A1S8ABP6_ROSNE|nr:putative cell death in tomato 1 [Rosellinia necatrix]
MQFSHHLQALGTAFALFGSAALGSAATTGDLSPWKVAKLESYQPSGRPGNSLDWYIHVNITNPDPTQGYLATEGKVYCQLVWQYPNAPYGQITPCTVVDTTSPVPWAWTVELLEAEEDPWPISNFGLRWRAVSTTPADANDDDGVQLYTGDGQFKVGDNLSGQCAASGFCKWYLKADSTPALVDVDSLPCDGSIEQALLGINCD